MKRSVLTQLTSALRILNEPGSNASEMSDPADTPDYYSTTYTWMTNNDFRHIEPVEDEVIVIPEKFPHVFYGCDDTHFAGMAP